VPTQVPDQIEACEGDVHQGLSSTGWLWHLTIPAHKLLENIELLFAIGPIHNLRLSNVRAHVAGLAACRQLRWVDKLDLASNNLTADDAVVLATSPHLSRLRAFDIHSNPIGERGAAAILDAGFTRLRLLNMSFARLGAEGVAHVATSHLIPGLETLALVSDEAPGDAIAPILAKARALGELRLSYNDIGDDGAIAIAEATHLDKLHLLALTGCLIDDAGVAALAAAPHLTNVTWLDLDSNVFTPVGARALAASTTIPNTCRLGVAKNRRLTTGVRNALKKRFRKI